MPTRSSPASPDGRRPDGAVALLKPDFGVTGGFEGVADWIEATLRRDGHEVERLTVGVDDLAHRPFGLPVPDHVWHRAPEYFRYLASLEAFERLDTRRYDAVVSTQPPSFATPHPRHLSLFFHHHRIFYDLEEPYLAAGFSPDPELHRRAAAKVRELDRPGSTRCAGSSPGPNRCAPVWPAGTASTASGSSTPAPAPGLDVGDPVPAAERTGPVHLRRPAGVPEAARAVRPGHAPHAWPAHGQHGVLVGRRRPHGLGAGGRRAPRAHGRGSGRGPGRGALVHDRLGRAAGRRADDRHRSTIAGRVDDARLTQLYREAPCVVAPAYEEDYGLTAVEAMRFGAPVVVCRDGGGLAAIVSDGVDGFVVDPDGPSHRQGGRADLRRRRAAGELRAAARSRPRRRTRGGERPTSSAPAWTGSGMSVPENMNPSR